MISLEELKVVEKRNNNGKGYVIVSFYKNGTHHIGEFCKTIEGFMVGLADCDPVLFEDDIPKFVSTKDLLIRSMKFDKNATRVELYKTDGTLIDKVEKE